MVVCRPSTLACTFYSLTSLAASHSPSFPFPLFYPNYVSPSSSFFSFSTLTFFLFILSLSHFPYFSFSSFPVALHRVAPPSRQDNLSLSFSALPLSLARLYARLAGSKTIRAFLSHFHITRRSRSCSRCGSLKADLQRS